MYDIWTEKYRPKDFDEVVGQDKIIERIKAFIKLKQIPHLLFAGPAGTGKSTLALIIANKLFGKEWKQNFLELNASDERGIDVVRNKIKDFARTKPIGNVPYKIIFLDEADALTSEAQSALRRTMENYSSICRFILNANYSSHIIEPIQSRCAVFKFSLITNDDIKKRLKTIIEKEKINIDSSALDAICDLSNGDIRKAINLLQTSAINSEKITEKAVYNVAGLGRPKEIKKMLEYAIKGNFLDSRKILNNMIYKEGVSAFDIIKYLSSTVYEMKISEKKKAAIIEKIGEYEFRLLQGANDIIQLESLLASLSVIK
ncbi:MAG: replication factor C small subunit [Candidatus Aenigmarchaeota archaeon]|nr:replication factor C small subunit [Candidatus Aenigmarchaeota archaeon]